MGFFNDIGKKTTETTSKIAKETKLKLKINEGKGKIKELYEQIGKQVYENHIKELSSNDETIAENCKQIDELSAQIEEARKEILALNHKKVCEKCFAEMEDNAAFCPKCGEKQPEEQSTFEKAEEKLEQAEVLPGNKEKKEEAEEEVKEKNEEE